MRADDRVRVRHMLVHGYFDLDAEIVWKTATVELPALLDALRRLVPED